MQYCGKLIDNDELKYPVELIKGWKRLAEDNAAAQIEKRPAAEPVLDVIQIVFDGWDLWRERGNLPGDSFVIISIWEAGAIRYSFNVRMRNTSHLEEQLHSLRVQLRLDGEVLFDDWYSIQFEIALPPGKWITRNIAYGFNSSEREFYDRADSIWFVGKLIGTDEMIAKKVADLDHGVTLQYY